MRTSRLIGGGKGRGGKARGCPVRSRSSTDPTAEAGGRGEGEVRAGRHGEGREGEGVARGKIPSVNKTVLVRLPDYPRSRTLSHQDPKGIHVAGREYPLVLAGLGGLRNQPVG